MLRRIAFGFSSLIFAAGLAACSSQDTLSSGGVPGIGPNFNTLSIYVTNSTQNAVSIFAPNPTSASAPINQIGGNNTQLNAPQFDAFDAQKRLYVTNSGVGSNPGSVTIYASQATGNVLPTGVISGSGSGISSPTGIVVDATGNIYVANVSGSPFFASSILIFSPASGGVSSPTSFISGAATGLYFPVGLALDSKGNILVANTSGAAGNGNIEIFAAGSNGNAAPATIIGGPLTGLVNPTGLILDSSGLIYVADRGTNSVSVFAANASGNVAPLRVISGANTTINNPSDVLLDKNGNLYVTNTAGGSGKGAILIFPSTASGNVAPAQSIPAPGNVVGLALSP